MIDTPFVNKKVDRRGDVGWIHAVTLNTAARVRRTKVGELKRLVSPFDQRTRVDHFANVEAGAESPANRSERIVRHTRHRRQHDRRPDTHLSDIHSQEFSRLGNLDVPVNGTSVDGMHRSYVTNNLESQLPRNRTRGVTTWQGFISAIFRIWLASRNFKRGLSHMVSKSTQCK